MTGFLMKRQFSALLLAAALLLPAAAGAQAQAPAPAPAERTLSVTGESMAQGRPDMALVQAGVVSEAATAGEALAANTAAMGRLVEALKAEGIEARDLQTANFSVEPRYSQPPQNYDGSEPFEPKIVGYSVRNELSVRIRDLAKIGALLDRAIAEGANSVSGPTFSVDQPKALEDEARRAAMRDAMARGALYAEAAGVALGPIARIEESVAQWPQPVPFAAMAREAADAPVPIEGGELTFRAQVSVTWRLAD
jgi:uncharacterized protein YggE